VSGKGLSALCQRGGFALHMADAWKDAASAAMDRYACGDDAAFASLYDLLAPRLSSFLLRRTRDPARTEDLMQQTFLQMHCARRHFAPGAGVTPWAFAIARRLLIDGLRRGGRDPVSPRLHGDDVESASSALGPDAIAARNRIVHRMNDALATVSEADRAAFELVKCDGLSMAEAGEVLGVSANAVKLRAFRAYRALRATLGDEVREELEGAW
jgi:RNA polymerase sigma-70 factor (ECF subfamily)